MAIGSALFKAGIVGAGASRLVMFRFPCNRIERLRRARNRETG
jgi:hypothetical protein